MSDSFTSLNQVLNTPNVVSSSSTLSGKKCRFKPQRNLDTFATNPIIFESPVLRLTQIDIDHSDTENAEPDMLEQSFIEGDGTENDSLLDNLESMEMNTKSINDSIIVNKKKLGSTQKPNYTTPSFKKPLNVESKRSLFGTCNTSSETNPTLTPNVIITPSYLTTPLINEAPLIIDNQPYKLFGRLGVGGSSEVRDAVNLETSQNVAIKIINMCVDDTTAKGFLDEVAILSQLQGSFYVIKMFSCERMGDKLYVVLEKGEYDFNHIITNQKFELVEIVSYWVQMLKAVKCIHDQGIIHSDLKPANFLIVQGKLKLIDFGIASNVQSDCTSIIRTNQTGTISYISPEALIDIRTNENSPSSNAKVNISFKSDIWSLGCILYRLIYGYTPFHHIQSKWGKLHALVDKNHQILYPDEPKLPRILMEVLQNCLKFEMRKRPSVDDLLKINYICNH